MRILYLAHRLPFPPNKGDKIRAFQQLKHLSRKHRIHLLALGDPHRGSDDPGALEEICESVEVFPISETAASARAILGVFRREPLTISYFRSPKLTQRIQELAASTHFDLVLAYSTAMVPYAAMIKDTPRVLDMIDVDSGKWVQYANFAPFPQHLIYHLESRRMRRYEAGLGPLFERVILTTRREARSLATIAPEIKTEVVRIGVCQEDYLRFDLPRSEEPTLVFMGQMDYFANTDGVCWFAHQIFPTLRTRYPDLRFVIVGHSPTSKVLALEDIPGVVVTGTVADVRPFLARSTVFVAPLRIARGVQTKVLEAMAAGLPVVCTPTVLAGIADGGFVDGKHLAVAPDDNTFVEAVGQLIEYPEIRSRMAANARRLVETQYSPARVMADFDRCLERATAGPEPHAMEAGREVTSIA